MNKLVCINSYGMELYLTKGKVYNLAEDLHNDTVWITLEELDNGLRNGRALLSRFTKVIEKPRRKASKGKTKPAIRKKSDITVTYANGKSYTIKDILAVYIQGDTFQVTRKTAGAPGVVIMETLILSNVISAQLKTPKELVSINNRVDGVLVDSRHHSFCAEYYFWEE